MIDPGNAAHKQLPTFTNPEYCPRCNLTYLRLVPIVARAGGCGGIAYWFIPVRSALQGTQSCGGKLGRGVDSRNLRSYTVR